MTPSKPVGIPYYLDHINPMLTPHIYVTDNFVSPLNEELPYQKGHELKLGCFIHCHYSERGIFENHSSLSDQVKKVQACIAHAEAFKSLEPTKVGKDLADYEINKDKALLKRVQKAQDMLNPR